MHASPRLLLLGSLAAAACVSASEKTDARGQDKAVIPASSRPKDASLAAAPPATVPELVPRPSAPPATAMELVPRAPPEPRERVEFDVELRIERVVRHSQFTGDAILAAVDPLYVVVGRVAWIERPDVFAVGSRQAIAIHSPSRAGLGDGYRDDLAGSTICWRLVRDGSSDPVTWSLAVLKPDAGCRGGG